VTRVVSSDGFLTEAVLVFEHGDADAFMAALPASADVCRAELQPTGHALFGGEKQFPRIRHEARVYTLEAFGCCATPTGRNDDPHEIVYILDGDVVLQIYGTADGEIELAARNAENRLDGLPPSRN
jgi:hypothetical protein